MYLSPMTTVGTVSLPFASDRTVAAASGSSQMLRLSIGIPSLESLRSSIMQKPQPGRQ